MKRVDIFVFGDSVAYGVGDDELGGWVNRLRLYLENREKNSVINIFNLSISGEISGETLSRFEFECKTRYKKAKQTVIVFAVGINDTQIVSGTDRVTLMQFEKNMRNLIEKGKKMTEQILVIGLTSVEETKVAPVFWNAKKNYFNNRIIIFDEKLENLCNEEKIAYIKVYDVITMDDLSDGLHLNRQGHKKMCGVVANKIIDLLI